MTLPAARVVAPRLHALTVHTSPAAGEEAGKGRIDNQPGGGGPAAPHLAACDMNGVGGK